MRVEVFERFWGGMGELERFWGGCESLGGF